MAEGVRVPPVKTKSVVAKVEASIASENITS